MFTSFNYQSKDVYFFSRSKSKSERESFTEKKLGYNAKYKVEGEPPSAHIIKSEEEWKEKTATRSQMPAYVLISKGSQFKSTHTLYRRINFYMMSVCVCLYALANESAGALKFFIT